MTSKERASSCLKILDSSFPDAACTLESDTPERLAVRGILSAQCTDERVNLTCRDLFEKYPQMKDILAAGKETIEEMIRPCGLHRMKADRKSHSWRDIRDPCTGRRYALQARYEEARFYDE